ncbi:MAG: hypothetical protein DYG88_11265 [Chloroflexi bacterium CFX4]|nr:hypothetical protein [Chloroflexi bacterium CFX4]MDL1922955.1 hypothetical protein [Chloroflexi bacterium CFX3]
MRRFALLMLLGTLIGLGIGLTLGWLVLPVAPSTSPLSDLARRHKEDYTIMVAAAFQVDNDLNAAVERLRLLGVADPFTYVRDLTERFIVQAGVTREGDARTLVQLSCAMGLCTTPMQPFLLPSARSGS